MFQLLALSIFITYCWALYPPISGVIELTPTNFDHLVLEGDEVWIVEFFAPWCVHSQALVPEYTTAASVLRGVVRVGAVNADEYKDLAERYGIRGFPTIKIFGKNKNKPEDYNGPRTARGLADVGLEKTRVKVEAAFLQETLDSEGTPVSNMIQVVDQESFNEICHGKSLCIVAFLPHILDCQSECRSEYLDILRELEEKYKKNMWGWVWSEGGAQLELESCLDVGGFGYPALAVMSAKKMKFSIFRGAFSNDGINEFLRDLSYGRGSSLPFKKQQLPEIVSVQPWDGKDGELSQEEGVEKDEL